MPTTTHALLQSLTTAPLLVTDLPEAKTFDRHRLQLPADPPPLNHDQKLGHLYEDTLALLLESSPTFDLLARNLQLQGDAPATIGELDFLLRDRTTSQLVHLELATKFYLAIDTPDGLALPGPDARDNYFIKLERLRTHQLTLTKRHQHALPQPYRSRPVQIRQLIYGCLFDHIHSTRAATAEFINPHCRRGRWLTIGQCPTHVPTATRFQIIPKPLWPVPLQLLDNISLETWNPQTEIDRCLMLRVDSSNTPHFIPPSAYPNHKN
ncbi:MAG: DUF1853 family protein [Verrucomicrobiales bacterium]|nr:DUF1853 family protein [Verrucomicrobiales bacterium]